MCEEKKKPKGIKAVFVSTVIVCAVVFGFIVTHILVVKNAEIDLLERQVELLSDVGAVPKAVAALQSDFSDLRDKLLPLTIVTQVDPVTGRCKFGGMDSPTELSTDFSQALKLVEEKKYDLALQKAEEMEKLLPSFLGSHYVRFLVNKDKGYADEAAAEAEILIENGSADERLSNVYVFLINHYLSKTQKSKAEELAIKALKLWPEDKALAESFTKVFGYTPTIEKEKETANQ